MKYIQEVIEEFKKVQWPSRRQTFRLTMYVIGVSLIVGLYVSALDIGYKELLSNILNN